MMQAAIVVEAGRPPVAGEFREPEAGDGEVVVHMLAAALSQVTRSRASGAHYSARDAGLPFVPGVDGIGTTEDGRRVCVVLPRAPFGTIAQRCVAAGSHCVPMPEGLDPVAAAAMANPGMSSWAALVERARLQPGETVLVNGASGISGRLAIQVARHLGAGRVVATARRASTFDDLRRLGADEVVALVEDAGVQERAFLPVYEAGVDVVLDYLWGASAQALVVAAAKAGPEGRAVRHVQIGALGGDAITLPGAALRSSALQLMGSGIGSIPYPRLLAAIAGVLAAAPSAGFEVATRPMPLSAIGEAWAAAEHGPRVVIQP